MDKNRGAFRQSFSAFFNVMDEVWRQSNNEFKLLENRHVSQNCVLSTTAQWHFSVKISVCRVGGEVK